MRNLKRALSLTLASVMLLGMMVVGSSAAGYPDVSEEENIEAIEVLQAVGVMGGDENGNFNPDDYVTREQMAVIMAQLLKLDYNYYKGTNPFSDVPEWAAPYVAACAANGVTAGIGGGLYGSKQNIQAVQAALMMLKALGYFQYAGDYGDSYVLATVKQGTEVGLFDGIDSNADSPLTRNQVAQMALNALQADMVSFTGDPGITYTGSNGETWVGGYKPEYTPRTSTQSKYQAIERRSSDVSGDANHRGQYYIQLGEELYDGKLRLDDADLDSFQRPSRTWEYEGEQIGTYVKKELLKKEWTTKVTGRDLYDLLSKNTIDTYEFVIAVDGEMAEDTLKAGDNAYFTKGNLVRTNTNAVGATDKGVLTQVFVDPDEGRDGTVWIAVINTYLAKASKDYDAKKEEVSFNVYGVQDIDTKNPIVLVKNTGDKDGVKAGNQPYTENLTVRNEDINVEDVKSGDIVLVNVAEGEIKIISDPEVLADETITAFKKGSWVNNGTQYDYADTALYDPEVLEEYDQTNMKNVTYDIYLDAYGYMIGLKQNSDPDQYVFITGMDGSNTNLKNRTYEVNAIFLDGRMDTITVNGKDSVWTAATDEGTGIMNTWCKYSVNSSEVYTLTEIGTSIVNEKVAQSAYNVNGSPREINRKSLSVLTNIAQGTTGEFSTVYGNDETVFITVSLDVIEGQYEYAKQATNTGQLRSNTNRWVNGTANEKTVAIIDDVDSVAVGVKNVSIDVKDVVAGDYKNSAGTAYNQTDGDTMSLVIPKHEIYSLYDDDGYIIASVVIGDDAGTSKSYAYITGETVKQEEYTAADDEWIWVREAVINGELGELRYRGSSLKYIGHGASNGDMKYGEWYEIRYDSNGYVRRADKLNFAGGDPKYVDTVEEVEAALKAHDTVILQVQLNNANDKLTFDRGTLYTDAQKTDNKGFWVSENVKTVVGLSKLLVAGKEGGVLGTEIKHLDDVTDGYDGRSGLEDAIEDLDKNFNGYLNVLFDSTGAVVIILDDHWGTKVDEGNDVVITETGDKYYSKVDQTITDGLDELDMSDTTNYNISNTFEITMHSLKSGNLVEQIKELLVYEGYTNIGDVTFNASLSKYVVTADAPNGAKGVQLTLDPASDLTEVATVTVDTNKKYILLDGSNDNLDDAGVTNSKHAKMVLNGKTSAIDGSAIDSTTVQDGAVYTSNAYTKVTAADITTAAAFTTSTCKYTVSFAIGTGDAVKSAAGTYYIGKDATLIATITGDANMASDLSTASKTKDTITITATGMTGSGGSVVFGTGNGETLAAKTLTITGPSTTVSDVTVAWGAATA